MKIKLGNSHLEVLNPLDALIVWIEIYVFGTFDVGQLPDKPTILECGTFIGISLIYFAQKYPGAKIVAFEPDPYSFELLRRNIETNNIDNVTLHNVALSNKNGSQLFKRSSLGIGSQLSSEDTTRDKRMVKVKTVLLSSFIKKKVDLLKIDIEGAENLVLREIEPTLHNVDNIIIEYHYGMTSLETNLEEIIDILERNNFSCRQGSIGKILHFLQRTTRLPIPHVVLVYGKRVSEL